MRFAIKRLTRSDLTFFEAQYRRQNAGNQKSINLNRDVFIDELYPDLPDIMAEGDDGGVQVRLRLTGPGSGRPDIRVTRKIIKNDAYKNYRLNGEFVKNPDEGPDRFDYLAAGDLALMVFDGAARPRALQLFVISAADQADVALHAALSPLTGRSMARLSRAALARAIASAPASHPVHDLFLEPELAKDLAEAAEGDPEAITRLLRRPGHRLVTTQQLARARQQAERVGSDGEALVNAHLVQRVGEGDLAAAVWVALVNAINPWDFEITDGEGTRTRIEVKSTTSGHGRPFHISMAELQAAALIEPYELWRISNLNDEGGALERASAIGPFARDVVEALRSLPPGVRPDGFTVDPALLDWSAPVMLRTPDPEEE